MENKVLDNREEQRIEKKIEEGNRLSPKKFVKQKFPDAKDMYRDEAGHAIMSGEIILSYGSTSAKAWKNAMDNILKSEIYNGNEYIKLKTNGNTGSMDS